MSDTLTAANGSQRHREGELFAGRRAARRLEAGHFAFMRAVLQGVDPKASWDRYLAHEGDGRDIRVVRQTIQWVRDEFAAAARRHARHGTARLVLIDAQQIRESKDKRPSLDEYIDANQLHDFSYAEQLEFYEEQYGKATQKQSRRTRLLSKQLEALRWLEGIAVQPPRLDDPVSTWLNPVLAKHLERAGITTLRALVDRINGVGYRWASTIPAIGEVKANRIVDWLRKQERALQLQVGLHVLQPRAEIPKADLHAVVPPSTAIVPLEKLLLPATLDGSSGSFRARRDQCTIRAVDDREAVFHWLRTKRERKADGTFSENHTSRAYLKEAERLLLWAVLERQLALSSLTEDDCLAYCRFLSNPSPREKWCGRRGRGKWSPLWRPFEGPLSVRAQRQAITILKNLFRYLVETRYLDANNWEKIALPSEVTPRTNQARSFTEEQWAFICECLDGLPSTSANMRLKLALPLLCATGLRLSEIVAARVGHLRQESGAIIEPDNATGERWTLQVHERGGEVRTVPISSDLIARLRAYLGSRGLSTDLGDAEIQDAAILGRSVDVADRAPWSRHARHAIDTKQGVTAGSLYDQIKDFFAECGHLAGERDGCEETAFSSASTEWLRHTHARRKAGVPVQGAQGSSSATY